MQTPSLHGSQSQATKKAGGLGAHYSRLTRTHRTSHRLGTLSAVLASAVVLGLGLSGCSAPSLDKGAATTSLNACTSALLRAQTAQNTSENGIGSMEKVIAAQQASSLWIEVAVNCSQRFSEGVIKAAAAHQYSQNLAAQRELGTLVTDLPTQEALPKTTVRIERSMAQAHDRAAFGIEVIAARKSTLSDADLALSLRHRRRATMLADNARACTTDARASQNGCSSSDPRKKIYSVENLLGNNESLIDPSTGLMTTPIAAFSMNCALQEISAVTSVNSNETPDNQTRRALATFIAADVDEAYSIGYPRTPLPLTETSLH